MSIKDLRDFIRKVDELGELRSINGADVISEVGPISSLARMIEGCPAVLFDEIIGYPKGHRVFANNVNSPKRTALALGIDPLLSDMGILRAWREKKKNSREIPPKFVTAAPFLENVLSLGQIDILRFPVPKWHEQDGGRYIGTGGVCVLRDPEKDWINVGIYRIQVHDKATLGLHFDHTKRHGYMIAQKYWEGGKNCPVAVAFGEDPALFMAAAEKSPWGSSEYSLAGLMKGSNFEVFESDLTGLPLPANSEFVIEGEMPPPSSDSRLEGPFGELTGYYSSSARVAPIIKVKRIMHRNDPILSGNPPLRPPYHTTGIPINAGYIWDDIEEAGIQASGVWQPSRGLTVISLKQIARGEAEKAGEIASKSRGAFLDRVIVIVDEDIDPTSLQDLAWALSTRCEASTGIKILTGLPCSTLDPLISPDRVAKGDFFHSKAIINACKPFEWKDNFPEPVRLDDKTRKRISDKWLRDLMSKNKPNN